MSLSHVNPPSHRVNSPRYKGTSWFFGPWIVRPGLLYIFLGWGNKIYSLLVETKPSAIKEQQTQQQSVGLKEKKKGKGDESVCIWREEVEMVMRRLGLFAGSESKMEEEVDCDDLCSLFEERVPSLDEVKIVFDVFDENRDGFIDAVELQRLMCALGLKEGFELGDCRRMIIVVDEDGDGRIDFNEFLKFMEKSIC